jgi:spore coat protein U domain-containing protein, fimbrial subunit CupE1/2/3/6
MTTRIRRLMAAAGMATLVAGFAAYQSAPLEAAQATASFNVTASVAANCTIVAGALGFGSYDPVVANASSPLDQTSTITVACTKGTNATVSLNLGTHTSGSTRRMQSGTTATEFLAYELYTTSGYGTVWNATNTVAYNATSKASSALTVYGRVAGGQDVETASYSDTIVATITF